MISLVGGGGKTTLMYAFAEYYAKRGLKTLATTTTHIFRPEETLWAKTAEEAEELWRHGSYAVAGRPAESGKLAALPETELAAELLHTEETDVLTPEGIAEILASERGARKLVGCRDYYVVLNKCDDEERICTAKKIRRLLSEKGVEHCVIACLGKEPVLRSEGGFPESSGAF